MKRQSIDTSQTLVYKAPNVTNEIVLIGAFFQCTKCNSIKPATLFGLRQMANNAIRNQAQCSTCRGEK